MTYTVTVKGGTAGALAYRAEGPRAAIEKAREILSRTPTAEVEIKSAEGLTYSVDELETFARGVSFGGQA